jgi:hypothetical protein
MCFGEGCGPEMAAGLRKADGIEYTPRVCEGVMKGPAECAASDVCDRMPNRIFFPRALPSVSVAGRLRPHPPYIQRSPESNPPEASCFG